MKFIVNTLGVHKSGTVFKRNPLAGVPLVDIFFVESQIGNFLYYIYLNSYINLPIQGSI